MMRLAWLLVVVLAVPLQAQTVRRLRITAYHDRGTTASGRPAGPGLCAAPADVPFGSRVYVPELDRWFIVADRTAKRFRHNTIDLWLPTHAACIRFGVRYQTVTIKEPTRVDRYPVRNRIRHRNRSRSRGALVFHPRLPHPALRLPVR